MTVDVQRYGNLTFGRYKCKRTKNESLALEKRYITASDMNCSSPTRENIYAQPRPDTSLPSGELPNPDKDI